MDSNLYSETSSLATLAETNVKGRRNVKLINRMVESLCPNTAVRRGGVELAGWIMDREIRVRFPVYSYLVLAF